MDAAPLSALAALAGSAIGALASFATTWLTQHAQGRTLQRSQVRNQRETLYGEFIVEASRLFADAVSHDLEDVSKLVHIYGVVSKMRLFAPAEIVGQAEKVVQGIVAAYLAPTLTARELIQNRDEAMADPLRAFSESCRLELGGI